METALFVSHVIRNSELVHITSFVPCYEGCLFYFGVREQKLTKIVLLLFKIFPIKFYTLLHGFESIVEALLPLWLRYRQNMHSERINRFFRNLKTLTSHFILYVREEKPESRKKSFGVKPGLYGGWLINSMFSAFKNAGVRADVWELALSWWRVIRLLGLVFLISWMTTGKQMLVYHSERRAGVVLEAQLRSFAWKCFMRNHTYMHT